MKGAKTAPSSFNAVSHSYGAYAGANATNMLIESTRYVGDVEIRVVFVRELFQFCVERLLVWFRDYSLYTFKDTVLTLAKLTS